LPAPYVPSAADIELIRRACPPGLLDAGNSPRILVLGVTRGLVRAPWPPRSELHAVDFDPVMIDRLWMPRAGAQCHLARWQEMPFPDGHFDLVIGDCSLNALPGLDHYDSVLQEVARVKRPSAPLALRFFMRPEPRLSLTGLLQELPGIATSSAAAKRLRILIASSELDGRTYFQDVPNRMLAEWGPPRDFLARLGMTEAEIDYAEKTYRFDQYLTFPSKQQIVDALGLRFEGIRFEYPAYDCGALCPTVSCR
jgi:SAM-dependent methyltransferase